MDLQPDQPVVGHERPQAELRADVQELDLLDRAGFGHRQGLVADLVADDQFGPLLVENQQPRAGQHVGLAYLSQGLHKAGHILVDESELQAVDVLGEPAGGRADHLAAGREHLGRIETDSGVHGSGVADHGQRVVVLPQDGEVHAELALVLEEHFQDHRLDEHLHRLHIELAMM